MYKNLNRLTGAGASAAGAALQRVADSGEAPQEEDPVGEVDSVAAEAVPAEADLILRHS